MAPQQRLSIRLMLAKFSRSDHPHPALSRKRERVDRALAPCPARGGGLG
jgi:hypothetical protein